jgi:enoyl-[acyl-carrier protein] reductase II
MNQEEIRALRSVLGRARAKKGMFEGDMEEGELEIGQSSALIDSILSVEEVFEKLLKEFESSCPEL